MASGKEKPDDRDDRNPFSFQSFIKKKSTNGDSDSDSSDDGQSNDFQKMSGESNSSQKNDEVVADNPFSFRKFLVKDAPPSNSSPRPPRHMNHGPDGYDSVPDIASGLPDFVQDQAQHDFSRRGSNNGRIRSASDLSLPDFVMGTNDAPSTAETTYSGVFPSINAIGSLIGRDEGPMYGKTRPSSSGSKKDLPRPGGIPSFLDSASISIDEDGSSGRDNVSLENRRLKEENASLRRQLLETRDMARHESERVAQLVQQVKTLQNHEAYETAALERMVQQVEANLEATTERAVKAESIISKQKHDIKLLREQIASSQMTNGAYGEPMDEVRDRTQYMSQQLAATAANAEVTLKQMIGGVQNLKLMSEILLSIGKIYDDPEEEGKSEKKTQDDTPKNSAEKNNAEKSNDAKQKPIPDVQNPSGKSSKPDKNEKVKDSASDDVRPKTKLDSGAKKRTVNKTSKEADKAKK